MIVIHGFAEHLGPYDDLCRRLAAENMLAFGHDHSTCSVLCFLAIVSTGGHHPDGSGAYGQVQ